ncbi:MAG: (2Fe-2S)-binding protein [Acidimicrobiales bacterium]
MYICHCRAVTDRTIRAAIGSGAATVSEVARRCGAGARCGGCWPALQELLAEATSDRACSVHPAA